MKYLVLGNGYLGNHFSRFFKCHLFAEKIKTEQMMHDILSVYKPEFVINCAGKTGRPNIDWCETHKDETFFANVLLPTYIQKACEKHQAKMVHIGSGCTYQGDNGHRGFSEIDEPNWSGNYYAWTKIVSERYLNDFDVLQIRIRMPFNHDNNSRNLLTKLLAYDKVVEANNSITYVPDLLVATDALVQKNATGIFNVVNRDGITHGRILHHYEKISNKKLNYKLISASDLDSMTLVRRSNCVLSVDKLDSYGIYMPSSIDAMERCVYSYCNQNNNIMEMQS
jgi:nucleoside-diphosphate-sugar epimerase